MERTWELTEFFMKRHFYRQTILVEKYLEERKGMFGVSTKQDHLCVANITQLPLRWES